MNRSCTVWLASLALLAASACTEDTPESATCPPYCNTPGPVLAGDGGAGPGGGFPDAGGGLDAGGTPGGSFDGAIIAPTDGGLGGQDSGSPADASSVDSGSDGSVAGDASTGPGSTLPPITDYAKPGPFKTTSQAGVGPNSNYTIFRPDPLGADGFVHAPIIFGPGIATSADGYTAILTHLASHGFVTISVNSMWGGPNDPANLSDMKTGLEWLIAQNSQAGVFQGKLAVNRAVAMGYSIGATAAVQLSSHPAIANTVVIHGHDTMGDPHGPVLMITGTSDVIDSMRKTLATLEEAPAVLVALPIGHLDVLTELPVSILFPVEISASTRYVAPITAWLRYWINGDQGGKRFFWGDGCEMCKSPWIPPEPNAKWTAQTL